MVDDCWFQIEPLVKLPLEKTGAIDLYSTDDILDLINKGEMQCWAVIDGIPIAAIVTQIIQYPRNCVFDVYLVVDSVKAQIVQGVVFRDKSFEKTTNCS